MKNDPGQVAACPGSTFGLERDRFVVVGGRGWRAGHIYLFCRSRRHLFFKSREGQEGRGRESNRGMVFLAAGFCFVLAPRRILGRELLRPDSVPVVRDAEHHSGYHGSLSCRQNRTRTQSRAAIPPAKVCIRNVLRFVDKNKRASKQPRKFEVAVVIELSGPSAQKESDSTSTYA